MAQKSDNLPPAMELLEESVHLLRSSGAALGAYYLGAMPFVLGFLYFWADMSRSPFASQRLVGASLAMAVLYVWMKFWQSVFTSMLLAGRGGQRAIAWSWGGAWKRALTQAAIAPWGLPAIAIAFVLGFPMPWVCAFFHNVSVLGDGADESLARAADATTYAPSSGSGSISRVIRGAWAQAAFRPGQSAVMLVILGLFSLVVFFNFMLAITVPSQMLKIFLDVETFFSRGGFSVWNTTFLAILAVLTYLSVDPIAKAAYVLRCFYGVSMRTGADLQAAIRRVAPARTENAGATAIVALVMVAIVFSAATPANAQCSMLNVQSILDEQMTNRSQTFGVETTPIYASLNPQSAIHNPQLFFLAQASLENAKPSVPPANLDESIRRVTSRDEYTWRQERSEQDKAKKNSFLTRVKEWFNDLFKSDRDEEDKEQPTPEKPTHEAPSSGGSIAGLGALLQGVMYVLIGVAVIAIVVVIVRELQKRSKAKDAKEAKPVAAATPDLADEAVTPEALPEEGWLELARRMMQQGDRRLALRAMYLASLSLLAQRQLITVAKFKSNRQYEAEVQRRAHSLPQIVDAFGQNVGLFEDAWYGLHEVTDTIVESFLQNQQRIRTLEAA